MLLVSIAGLLVSNLLERRFPKNRTVVSRSPEYSTGKTQVQIAEEINTTSQYVNRVIKKKDGVINNTFVQMMEALGYDIEITYVKRKADGE